MRLLLLAMLVAVVLAASGWFSHASAQAKRPLASASVAAAERAAVDLRQGMTLEEVQQLLGKPWRTALTSGGSGTLRWTYTWPNSTSVAERNLNIDFAAKAPEHWTVNGWSWSTY
ncbi:MAG TPA: hypothetical protein VFJ70_23355 [Burkholderiales bacterium]|nr:hypothetical protein [Burkholderiales bacterium]